MFGVSEYFTVRTIFKILNTPFLMILVLQNWIIRQHIWIHIIIITLAHVVCFFLAVVSYGHVGVAMDIILQMILYGEPSCWEFRDSS